MTDQTQSLQSLRSRIDAVEHLSATSICVMTMAMSDEQFDAYMGAFDLPLNQAIGLCSQPEPGVTMDKAGKMFNESLKAACDKIRAIRATAKLLDPRGPAND